MLRIVTSSKDLIVDYEFLKSIEYDFDTISREYGLILQVLKDTSMEEIGELELAKEIAHYLSTLVEEDTDLKHLQSKVVGG